jgi:hypothetical protein
MQFNVFVVLKTKDGRQEAFELKPSRVGGAITGKPDRGPSAASPRVPKDLEGALRNIKFVPGPSHRLKTGDLVAKIARATSIPLYVDRRVEGDILEFDCPSSSNVSQLDVAFGLATSLDMYWRKVDNAYFLAVSPRDPRELAKSRFYKRIEDELMPVLNSMNRDQMLPNGISPSDLLATDRPLSDFSPTFLSGLEDEVVFSSDLDRQRLSDVIKSDDYLNGSVQFCATGTPFLTSVEGRFFSGGYAFHFEHP